MENALNGITKYTTSKTLLHRHSPQSQSSIVTASSLSLSTVVLRNISKAYILAISFDTTQVSI